MTGLKRCGDPSEEKREEKKKKERKKESWSGRAGVEGLGCRGRGEGGEFARMRLWII